MSLKALHIVFITAATLLSFGIGFWGSHNYLSGAGGKADLIYGVGSFVVGVALLIYGRYFLKKLKKISYL